MKLKTIEHFWENQKKTLEEGKAELLAFEPNQFKFHFSSLRLTQTHTNIFENWNISFKKSQTEKYILKF